MRYLSESNFHCITVPESGIIPDSILQGESHVLVLGKDS